MTKRETQAAEYASEHREQCRRVGEWMRRQFYNDDGSLIPQSEHDERFRESIRTAIEKHREDYKRMHRMAAKLSRRDTFGIRVHRAVSKWARIVWLKFLGR